MFVMSDDDGVWFVDGAEVLQSRLHELKVISVPASTRVFAFKAENDGGGAFAILATTTGVYTNSSWKCVNEEPSTNGAKQRAKFSIDMSHVVKSFCSLDV